MGVEPTNEKHEAVYQELTAVLQKWCDELGLSSVEVLAILSNMVGKAIALQDQRKMTREAALRIVMNNIELGNQQMMARVMGEPAGHA